MEKKPYIVAKEAGDWVAGVRVPEDRILHLTDEQAEYPKLYGHISAEKTVVVAKKK